jgi:hypothetical protein
MQQLLSSSRGKGSSIFRKRLFTEHLPQQAAAAAGAATAGEAVVLIMGVIPCPYGM